MPHLFVAEIELLTVKCPPTEGKCPLDGWYGKYFFARIHWKLFSTKDWLLAWAQTESKTIFVRGFQGFEFTGCTMLFQISLSLIYLFVYIHIKCLYTYWLHCNEIKRLEVREMKDNFTTQKAALWLNETCNDSLFTQTIEQFGVRGDVEHWFGWGGSSDYYAC